MIGRIVRDALELTRASNGGLVTVPAVGRAVLFDAFPILVLERLRKAARRYHVPLVNRTLRLTQTALYGIEIGKDVTLGDGVYFVHSLGVVIGGDARIGNRVKFMGNNTVGTAKDNGYPTLEDDVTVGSGARILGPVRIGAGAVIGANAVVLDDVPAGATAVGIPARILGAANPPGKRNG